MFHTVEIVYVIITGLNEVVAKVIFLHLSVILFTGGGRGGGGGYPNMPCGSVSGGLVPGGLVWGVWLQGVWVRWGWGVGKGGPLCFFLFFFLEIFFDFCFLWGYPPPPPRSRIKRMVNEWPVRILLECILVFSLFLCNPFWVHLY